MDGLSVYIIVQSNDNERAESVAKLFDDNFFNVSILNISIPPNLPIPTGMSQEEAETNYRWIQALSQAKQEIPNDPVLITADTTTTNTNSSTLAEIISAILSDELEYEYVYLADWLDQCQNFSDLHNLTALNPDGSETTLATLLAKTKSPNGLQCILFTVDGRDIVLGDKPMNNGESFTPITYPLSYQLRQNIQVGNIVAVTTSPALLDYNIAYASKPKDYLRANECSVNVTNNTPTTTSPLSALWFIIIAVIIVILAWFAIHFSV